MSQQELVKKVIQILDTAGIDYMMTGSIVSSLQGEPRATHDGWRFTMTTVQTDIPDPLYQQLADMSQKENMPIDQLIALALAQALGTWTQPSMIAKRAKRASRPKYDKALAQTPKVEPEAYDRLK